VLCFFEFLVLQGCYWSSRVTTLFYHLSGKENTYFDRSLEKLGANETETKDIPDAPCTTAFCNLMREVANSGHLGEMLSVIVVCEWSYQSWGERVLPKTKRNDFENYEWVDLHSGPFFAGVVEYLRGLLDKEGISLDEEGREKCRKRFLEAVQCEEDFFNFAYSG
jgi:thiaminase/transcriptional activator TenA